MEPISQLKRCQTVLAQLASMLTSQGALDDRQVVRADELLDECLREAEAFPSLGEKLALARRKVTRYTQSGDYMEFLARQYESNGMTSGNQLARLVVSDAASYALKQARLETLRLLRAHGAY